MRQEGITRSPFADVFAGLPRVRRKRTTRVEGREAGTEAQTVQADYFRAGVSRERGVEDKTFSGRCNRRLLKNRLRGSWSLVDTAIVKF